MNKKIIILFTDSNMTKWKEYVTIATVSDIKKGLSWFDYDVDSIEFVGFNDTLASHLKSYDLVFNLCYGYYDKSNQIDIGQDSVVKWLDENGIKHTTTKYLAHRIAMDKSSYKLITADIDGILSPIEFPNIIKGEIIKKPKFGSCHRDILIYNNYDEFITRDKLDTDNYLYQEYIKGREFSIAVIPDKETKYRILSPIEIVSEKEVFIIGVGRGTSGNYNPNIDPEILSNINKTIIEIHEKLGLEGITRTDLKLSKDNKLYLLDINAMPNLDLRQTFLPKMIIQSNLTYNGVLNAIVEHFI